MLKRTPGPPVPAKRGTIALSDANAPLLPLLPPSAIDEHAEPDDDDYDEDESRTLAKRAKGVGSAAIAVKKCVVPLAATEFRISSSFPDAKPHGMLNASKQTLSLAVSSDASNAFVTMEVDLKRLMERVGMRITLTGTAAETRACIQIARQLSSPSGELGELGELGESDASTASIASGGSDGSDAAPIAEAVRRGVRAAARYHASTTLPFLYAAKHPKTGEETDYKVAIAASLDSSTPRVEIAFTCVETGRTAKRSIEVEALVRRVLLVSCAGQGDVADEAFFTATAICKDTHTTDEQPWRVVFATGGAVSVHALLPDDVFVDGARIFVPVMRLLMSR